MVGSFGVFFFLIRLGMKIVGRRNKVKGFTVDKEGGRGSFVWFRVFLV